MLTDPLTLGTVLAARDRVYGRSDDKYQRQADYLSTLGAILDRHWGDTARQDEIRAAVMEVMP